MINLFSELNNREMNVSKKVLNVVFQFSSINGIFWVEFFKHPRFSKGIIFTMMYYGDPVQ